MQCTPCIATWTPTVSNNTSHTHCHTHFHGCRKEEQYSGLQSSCQLRSKSDHVNQLWAWSEQNKTMANPLVSSGVLEQIQNALRQGALVPVTVNTSVSQGPNKQTTSTGDQQLGNSALQQCCLGASVQRTQPAQASNISNVTTAATASMVSSLS